MKQIQNDKVHISKKQDTKMSQASASLWEKKYCTEAEQAANVA